MLNVDSFGVGTMIRPWDGEKSDMDLAKARMEEDFELVGNLNIQCFCFHGEI